MNHRTMNQEGGPAQSRSQASERDHRERGMNHRERARASRLSALYNAGLRPSPHPVFGSTFLRAASPQGAFLNSDRLTSSNRE